MDIHHKCLWCEEVIGPGEPFEITNCGALRLHRECIIRSVVGSVGHQQKTCSCFGGTMEDPAGATRREAAIAAATLFVSSHENGKSVKTASH